MAAEGIEKLKSVISLFQAVADNPEVYLNPPDSLPKDTAQAVKSLFDFAKHDELKGSRHGSTCPLQKLLVENFDDEQIWQEIELQNEPVLSALATEVSNLGRKKRKITVLQPDLVLENQMASNCANGTLHENKRQRSLQKEVSNDESVDSDHSTSSEEEITLEQSETNEDLDEANIDDAQKSKQGSVVDDKFFKLADMLEFLDKEDRKFEQARAGKKKLAPGNSDDDNEAEEEEEFVDLFADIDSEDQEDDSEDWDNAVDATAKLMGRSKVPIKRPHLKARSAGELKYADFFDPPEEEEPTKRRKEMQEEGGKDGEESNDEEEGQLKEELDIDGSDQDEEDDIVEGEKDDDSAKEESMSTFEKNQMKLKQKIEKLEKANLASKPWQMSGETTSKVRPMNSLLAEDLDFDHTTAAAPVITEETTKDLESMVKQRIKDEAWDDVERKTKPAAEPYEYKKRQPLDQEKSKLSLSQIYEQEYLKQTQDEAEEKESEEHAAIKALMSKLFVKLDALSNFHFTPKPVKPELKIVSNAPAISMEEVAPVAVSDAMLLAPEEIQEKAAEVKGDTEKTATDRKHDRRLKKKKQRMRAKEKESRKKLIEKANPGLGNKHSKQAAMKRLEKETKSGSGNVSIIKEGGSGKNLATSSAFFTRLQDEVKAQIKTKTELKKKKKARGEGMSAPRLKL